jgi:hypothetical protein
LRLDARSAATLLGSSSLTFQFVNNSLHRDNPML